MIHSEQMVRGFITNRIMFKAYDIGDGDDKKAEFVNVTPPLMTLAMQVIEFFIDIFNG